MQTNEPDDLQREDMNDEIERLQKRIVILTAVFSVCVILSLFLGWGIGSLKPIPVFDGLRQAITASTKADSDTKIPYVMQVMKRYWYFSNQIENIDERLSDQALTGITSNEEDPHTEYMSKEEIEQFTQGINRNFIGIGVTFTTVEDGLHLVTRVLRDSPAEKAGVQAGDIIHSVDGTVVDGLSAQELKDLVQGEEGTDVTIVFLRDGKYVTLDITRSQVGHTVKGDVTEDGIAMLTIEQFGESTPKEVQEYLDEFLEKDARRLIIDLRDDGGGYLDVLRNVASLFLPANKVFIRRVYTNGKEDLSKTEGGQYRQFSPIVILVNENTASAAEAFTLCMKENRNDVTIIGEKTYGKGSVQITQYFEDGSALKYTDSIWKSPNGNWINGTGIEPDVTVHLHPVLSASYVSMEEGEEYRPDQVSEAVKEAQLCLDFLKYDPGRTDGYFSAETDEALRAFAKDHELAYEGILNGKTYETLISAVIHEWVVNPETDTQYQKALELLRQAKEQAAASVTETESRSFEGILHPELTMAEEGTGREERYGTI